jgi:hypothetical protein
LQTLPSRWIFTLLPSHRSLRVTRFTVPCCGGVETRS